jgi:hypothetical protein
MKSQFNVQAADTLFDTLAQRVEQKPKFNWQQIIIQALESKKGKKMPLKILQKKVLAEFEATGGGSATDVKTIAKFNKELKKIPDVVVHKEIAKLTY